MIFHIVKRELYDHLSSLRFALTTLLILILMIVNAVVYIGEYKQRMSEYRGQIVASRNELKSRCSTLYRLALKGPGHLYKKPSPLAFCADGGEKVLLGEVRGNTAGRTRRWRSGDTSYKFTEIWGLIYPPNRDLLFISDYIPGERSIMPDYIKIDWGFVTAALLSFMGILFTFDAISGEQERGTLRLMLANSISRNEVIFGKFLSAFFAIATPFLIGAIVCLSIIHLSETVQYFARIKEPPRRETPATIATALGAEYVNKDAELRDRLRGDYLFAELRQIQNARSLTRISPAATVQYAFEALAGTGFSRHLDFISQTRQYAKQFRQFLTDTDRSDPESPHAVGIPEGTSQRPVNFDAVPKFEDQHRFGTDFNAAIVDLLLLILFLLVLFIGTFLSFLRMEIG